jgi:probable rRNA maturation factor
MSKKISIFVDLQKMVKSNTIPDSSTIEYWIKTALLEVSVPEKLKQVENKYELTVRIVSKNEIQQLNKTYRHKDKTTNILSFPFETFSFQESELPVKLLGDLVICHDIIVDEAHQQQKKIAEHWAHMMVHGVLHLIGYDHLDDHEADVMENLEVQILDKLNIHNPYQ